MKRNNSRQMQHIITLWKIIESMGIDFADFVALFKEKLGKDFTFIDI